MAFNEALRALGVSGIDKLPELVTKLCEVAESTTERIVANTALSDAVELIVVTDAGELVTRPGLTSQAVLSDCKRGTNIQSKSAPC